MPTHCVQMWIAQLFGNRTLSKAWCLYMELVRRLEACGCKFWRLLEAIVACIFDKFDGTCSKFQSFLNQVRLSHLIAPPSLSKWPILGWPYCHVAIRHNLNMVRTFVRVTISIVKWSWTNSVSPLKTLTKNAHQLTNYELFVKDHA
jgi:hypothetical protein